MMRRLMFFIGGALLGMMVGSSVTLLLTPASGKSMRKDAKSRLHGIVDDARQAADDKRRELEAELAELIGTPAKTRTPTHR